MKLLKTLVFVSLAFPAHHATAAIIFEPSLGYSLTNTKSVNIANAEGKNEMTSPLAGLRLGYISSTRFWLGIDGLALFGGKLKVKEPRPTVSQEYDATAGSAFVSIGYETRSRLRMWAGYGVYDTLMVKDFGSVTGEQKYSGGTSWKAGLGFHLVPHLSLNLEYIDHSYKRYKTPNSAEGELSGTGLTSFTSNTMLASFSMPFFW